MSTFKVNISGPGGIVIFQASATVGESRSASYDPYGIVHLPTSLLAYRNTGGRRLSIQGKLVSRNQSEAGANAKYLNLIRGWLLPDFGGTGATPPIVYLSAFNNDNIDSLQCVITNYSWSFPEDVDYIYTGSIPMPIIGMISVDLEEVYSAEQITAKAWAIKNNAYGSFENNQSFENNSTSGGGGGGSGGNNSGSSSFNDDPSFCGIATQNLSDFQKNSGLYSKSGSILETSKTDSINGSIGSNINQSAQLVDNFTNSGVINNVFQTGITQATLANQTVTPQEAFRNTEIIESRDSFQRDSNPAPPDLANFYG